MLQWCSVVNNKVVSQDLVAQQVVRIPLTTRSTNQLSTQHIPTTILLTHYFNCLWYNKIWSRVSCLRYILNTRILVQINLTFITLLERDSPKIWFFWDPNGMYFREIFSLALHWGRVHLSEKVKPICDFLVHLVP